MFDCYSLYSGPVIPLEQAHNLTQNVMFLHYRCTVIFPDRVLGCAYRANGALLERVLFRENQMWLIGDLGLSYFHLCPHTTCNRGQTWPPTGRLLFVSLCNTFPDLSAWKEFLTHFHSLMSFQSYVIRLCLSLKHLSLSHRCTLISLLRSNYCPDAPPEDTHSHSELPT